MAAPSKSAQDALLKSLHPAAWQKDQVNRLVSALAKGRPKRQGNLEKIETDKQTFFSGAGKGARELDSGLNTIFKNTGGGTTGYAGATADGISRLQGEKNDLAKKDNFRQGIVAASNASQQQVQDINEEIFTDRRKRRGSSTAIPRSLMTGLGQAKSLVF